MYKLLPIFIVALSPLVACHTPDNSEALQIINKSFINAQAILSEKNEDIYEALIDKREDPLTRTKANVWEPKAVVVKKLSGGITNYISTLQQQLSAAQQADDAGVKKLILEMGDSLYARLVKYNTAVVQVLNPEEFPNNPMQEAQLRKDIENFQKDISARSGIRPGGMHGKTTNLQNWKRVYLDERSPILVTAMLNKIEQDVMVTEHTIARYINNQVSSLNCGNYERFSAVMVLSSSYVKAGQKIEVTAGVGAFSAATSPAVYIDGIKTRLNDEGVALYSLKATGKPGKYTVPVKVEYYRPDGTRALVTRNLEYIIAE